LLAVVALAVNRVFMVAAMLAVSLCMRWSVSVKLLVVWLGLLSKVAWRGCLGLWFPRGIGFYRCSSMCEMSESVIDEAMSLSASLAS
jgi:hypothetical protein